MSKKCAPLGKYPMKGYAEGGEVRLPAQWEAANAANSNNQRMMANAFALQTGYRPGTAIENNATSVDPRFTKPTATSAQAQPMPTTQPALGAISRNGNSFSGRVGVVSSIKPIGTTPTPMQAQAVATASPVQTSTVAQSPVQLPSMEAKSNLAPNADSSSSADYQQPGSVTKKPAPQISPEDAYNASAKETMANSPVMQSIANQNDISVYDDKPGYKQGGEVVQPRIGMVRGAGTSTSDSIPAKLSNGEYVIPADVVRHFGVKHFDNMVKKVTGDVPPPAKEVNGAVHAFTGGFIDESAQLNPNSMRPPAIQREQRNGNKDELTGLNPNSMRSPAEQRASGAKIQPAPAIGAQFTPSAEDRQYLEDMKAAAGTPTVATPVSKQVTNAITDLGRQTIDVGNRAKAAIGKVAMMPIGAAAAGVDMARNAANSNPDSMRSPNEQPKANTLQDMKDFGDNAIPNARNYTANTIYPAIGSAASAVGGATVNGLRTFGKGIDDTIIQPIGNNVGKPLGNMLYGSNALPGVTDAKAARQESTDKPQPVIGQSLTANNAQPNEQVSDKIPLVNGVKELPNSPVKDYTPTANGVESADMINAKARPQPPMGYAPINQERQETGSAYTTNNGVTFANDRPRLGFTDHINPPSTKYMQDLGRGNSIGDANKRDQASVDRMRAIVEADAKRRAEPGYAEKQQAIRDKNERDHLMFEAERGNAGAVHALNDITNKARIGADFARDKANQRISEDTLDETKRNNLATENSKRYISIKEPDTVDAMGTVIAKGGTSVFDTKKGRMIDPNDVPLTDDEKLDLQGTNAQKILNHPLSTPEQKALAKKFMESEQGKSWLQRITENNQ